MRANHQVDIFEFRFLIFDCGSEAPQMLSIVSSNCSFLVFMRNSLPGPIGNPASEGSGKLKVFFRVNRLGISDLGRKPREKREKENVKGKFGRAFQTPGSEQR